MWRITAHSEPSEQRACSICEYALQLSDI